MKQSKKLMLRVCAGVVLFEVTCLFAFTKFAHPVTNLILLTASMILMQFLHSESAASNKYERLSIPLAIFLLILAITLTLFMPQSDQTHETTTAIKFFGAIMMVVVPVFYIWHVRQFIKKMDL